MIICSKASTKIFLNQVQILYSIVLLKKYILESA